jgi:cyanophycinase
MGLVEDFVRRAGGPGKARIAVFAEASQDGQQSGESKAAQLRRLGAAAQSIWVDRGQADTDSVAALLDGVTGVWFGGGDQNRLTAVLRGTRTERAIRARFEQGAVVGGTSAGAAVLSALMITGDEIRDPSDSSEAWTRIRRGSVALDSGFAFLQNAVVDQHFIRRRRHNRLISVVLSQQPHLGVGIDEGTALIIPPKGPWRVAGASSVLVFDARRAVRPAKNEPFGATGLVMHVLPDGGTFDPETGKAKIR